MKRLAQLIWLYVLVITNEGGQQKSHNYPYLATSLSPMN